MDRIKVLFIHNTLPEYRVSFFRELSRIVDLTLAITDWNLASTIYDLDTVIPKNLLVWRIKNLRDISQMIKSCAWDVVVLPPADTIYQYLCGVIAVKCAKKRKLKIVYWTEKWESIGVKIPLYKKIKNFIHRFLIWSLTKNSDICIAAGSRSACFLKSIYVPVDKIKIAFDSSTSPKCISFDLKQKYNIPENAKIILFLGRLVERKGCSLLINSFNDILALRSDVYLLIGGEGEDECACKRLAKEFKIENNIRFLGKIDPRERALFYKKSDIFVLPSYIKDGIVEAWGLTVNESLEQGTPVVSTDAVGAAFDLLDGTNGAMVVQNNKEQLTIAISHFLDSSNNRLVSEYCQNTYEKYSVKQMALEFGDSLKACVS